MPERRQISKSRGHTPTEESLSQLCDRTFLKLWSYANPVKSDGQELCDLIAVFENHVFVFFDRESRIFETSTKDTHLTWERWKRAVIDKQINTANGAQKYILRSPDEIYLDAKRTLRLPIRLTPGNLIVHKIAVAHGAADACKNFSSDNVAGSLAITYSDDGISGDVSIPFIVHLDRSDPVHILDSHNLRIILGELDAFRDLVSYLTAKEAAISKLDCIAYCGEEDLLGHYFANFDHKTKTHFIGVKGKRVNGLFIGEGEWHSVSNSEPYRRKKSADKISYLWDDLLQRTSQNALDGTLLGNSDIYNSRSAIFEMAKEPRFARRALAECIKAAIQKFPYEREGRVRQITFMHSFYKDKAYVFLQLRCPDDLVGDYDTEYRPKRQAMLAIACGVARNKYPHLKKVIGIGIDAPKDRPENSEDFVLLDGEWGEEERKHYEEANRGLRFFETSGLEKRRVHVSNFPKASKLPPRVKIGRNEQCPCGSGKKFKRCHGR